MKRLLLTALLAVCVAFPLAANYTPVFNAVRPLQAVGETGELQNICTTTSINEKAGYWLTAGHCVQQPDFIGGVPAYVIFLDEANDIAVLQADVHVKGLKLQRSKPYVGQRINVIGHPLGIDVVQWFRGYMSSLDTPLEGQHFALFDMNTCHGNSGSAVVNTDSEIVSVLQIGFGRDQCAGFTGGVTWPVLVKEVGPYVR